MAGMETIKLQAGRATLEIAPDRGGGIAGWSIGDGPVLHPRLDEVLALRYATGLGAYPLVPYSNRIAHGRFTWEGRDYQLPLDAGSNSIHGVGWESAWQPGGVTPTSAALTLAHAPGPEWPFAFDAEQRFALTETSLAWRMTVTNRHDAPAPMGFGLHPYFPRGDGCDLTFAAATVWRSGPDMLPTACVPVPPEWDHWAGRRVGEVALDNCFNGWTRRATLRWPGRKLTVAIVADEVFAHVVAFTPEGRDFLAVEPVTNMNDAINHGAMATLAPGATMSGEIRFELTFDAA